MKFTKEQHKTWQTLFKRQLPNIEKCAGQEFLEGFARLKLPSDHIPTLAFLNSKITKASGWKIVRTPVRYLTDLEWAHHMANREFPITNFIRTRQELDFTPEPDIFHDVFGHLPMLMQPDLIQLIEVFSAAYKKAKKEQLPAIAQLWWNTIEFSLIKSDGDIKAFGAGLMSSFGEIHHAVSDTTHIKPFSIARGIQKPRAKASFHPEFLVFDSVKKLEDELALFLLNKKGRTV